MPKYTLSLLLTLIAVASLPSHALTPPPPPPCVPASADITVEALGEKVAKNSGHASDCAVADLVARGAAAVPVATKLLGNHDAHVQAMALKAIEGLGPLAGATVPYIIKQIRKPDSGQAGREDERYSTLGHLGKAAAPAIPLLLAQSNKHGENSNAIDALGMLGRYSPDTVVPQLVRLLRRKGDTNNALSALHEMGRPARKALPALMAYLNRAIRLNNEDDIALALEVVVAVDTPANGVALLVDFLGRPKLAHHAATNLGQIGPPAVAAVPALISTLNSSRADKALVSEIVRALWYMAPVSLAAQKQLLIDATDHDNEEAAIGLIQIKPLPADFAPKLQAALKRRPGNEILRRLLAQTQPKK